MRLEEGDERFRLTEIGGEEAQVGGVDELDGMTQLEGKEVISKTVTHEEDLILAISLSLAHYFGNVLIHLIERWCSIKFVYRNTVNF